jgi:hypothetical protein
LIGSFILALKHASLTFGVFLAGPIQMLWLQNFFIYCGRLIFVARQKIIKNHRGNYDSGYAEKEGPGS